MEQHEIRKRLKKELDKGRYEHTKGVMYTAGCMAMAYETSIEQAMLAGLLHDCAKCIPDDEKLQICEEHDIPINAVEYESPFLLHAKAIFLFLYLPIFFTPQPEQRIRQFGVTYSLGGTALTYLLTRNVTKALSILMVDFSCALKLAMPISVLSAIREAGFYNMTVKGGKYLEAMAEADTISRIRLICTVTVALSDI